MEKHHNRFAGMRFARYSKQYAQRLARVGQAVEDTTIIWAVMI